MIRITDIETGKLKGISKKCFSIVRGTLSITTPTNSDLFTIGDTCNISWKNKGTTGPVDLFYSDTINQTNWHPIGTTLPENGHYNWKLTSDIPAAVNLMIRSSTYLDILSKNPVRIYVKKAPVITVLNPKSGSSIYNKSSLTIQWTATSSITLLKIQISVDSGNTWETLVDSVPNTGTFTKMVNFDYQYPDCYIKISDKANPLYFDMNDSSFSIINSTQTNDLQDQNKYGNAIHLKIGKIDFLFDVNGTNHNLVSLELFSLNGKKTLSLPPTNYSVGMQTLPLFINKIPKETYLLKIQVNKKSLFKKFTMVDN